MIDADKLIENFEWCKKQAGRFNEDHWKDVIQRVNEQPTIGPATMEQVKQIRKGV